MTITVMMIELVGSPKNAETRLATRRMMTSGLRNNARISSSRAPRRRVAIALGPYTCNRWDASAELNPLSLLVRAAKCSATGLSQNSAGGVAWRDGPAPAVLDRI